VDDQSRELDSAAGTGQSCSNTDEDTQVEVSEPLVAASGSYSASSRLPCSPEDIIPGGVHGHTGVWHRSKP
jgi:hypothetical protein